MWNDHVYGVLANATKAMRDQCRCSTEERWPAATGREHRNPEVLPLREPTGVRQEDASVRHPPSAGCHLVTDGLLRHVPHCLPRADHTTLLGEQAGHSVLLEVAPGSVLDNLVTKHGGRVSPAHQRRARRPPSACG
jgi:hypothetical protein